MDDRFLANSLFEVAEARALDDTVYRILDEVYCRKNEQRGVWLESGGAQIFICLPLPCGATLVKESRDGRVNLYAMNGAADTRIAIDGTLAEVAEALGLPAPPEVE